MVASPEIRRYGNSKGRKGVTSFKLGFKCKSINGMDMAARFRSSSASLEPFRFLPLLYPLTTLDSSCLCRSSLISCFRAMVAWRPWGELINSVSMESAVAIASLTLFSTPSSCSPATSCSPNESISELYTWSKVRFRRVGISVRQTGQALVLNRRRQVSTQFSQNRCKQSRTILVRRNVPKQMTQRNSSSKASTSQVMRKPSPTTRSLSPLSPPLPFFVERFSILRRSERL
mmetsp:Transcript_29270/g.61245  ORF Transcript_29270/g.61245 Transcript_29270/m.61245 type:complete len:231 (-) Transcript_29270:597-1289(-)